MRLLLSLYPRAWQERYADELAALVEERGLSTHDVLDLIRGAVDARLQLQTLPASGSLRTRRVGAAGAVLGGATLGALNLAPAVGLAALPSSLPDWLMFLLPLCFLAPSIALYSVCRGRLGGLGRLSGQLLAGSLVAALLGMAGLAVTDAFWLLAFFGLLGSLVGLVLFGAAVARHRPIGRLSFMPIAIGLLGLTSAFNGEPAYGRLGYEAGLVLWSLFALAWLLLGLALLSRASAPAARTAES